MCMLLLLLLSRFSHVRLCDPIDDSPPVYPVPRILQARTPEWVAISFSNAWNWKVKVKSLSRVRLLATPWTAAHQAPPPMRLSRQEHWSELPLPSPWYVHRLYANTMPFYKRDLSIHGLGICKGPWTPCQRDDCIIINLIHRTTFFIKKFFLYLFI